MEFLPTDLPGAWLLKPRVFPDERGYFFESFSQREFDKVIPHVKFVQDNQSRSTHGVVRGLHFQAPPFAQAKLVRCVQGAVLDIGVDIRVGSPTFGKYIAVELNEDNKCQLFLPRGMAHGFAVLSDVAVFEYKCDNYYAPESEGGVNLFDTELAIKWPVAQEKAILSPKDLKLPLFKDFNSPFKY